MSNQLTTQTAQVPSLKLFNQKIVQEPKTQEYLQQVLGAKKDSFVNNLVALVANNKKLQECEPMGLMYSAVKATALGLPIDSNLGFAYFIPYKNNRLGITEAQFQIGYKGFVQLAIRSGQYKTINVTDIREGEIKKKNLLTGEIEFEEIEDRINKPIVGYVAYIELNNGFNKLLYMTDEELQQHAKKYSKTFNMSDSKWKTDFDAMAKKTVLKLLISKFGVMSVEMQNAVKYDQAVIRDEDGTPNYVDNGSIVEDVQAEIIEEQGKDVINIEEETAQTAAPF